MEPLTDETDGRRKETGQILTPVIGNGNLQVLDGSRIFKHVRKVGRHVDNILFGNKNRIYLCERTNE